MQFIRSLPLVAFSVALCAPSIAAQYGPFTGDGTNYDITVGLGACGIPVQATDLVAAVPVPYFNSFPGYNGLNPNNNPVCGLMASVTYQGTTIQVKVVDSCPGCGPQDLDLSNSAFQSFADLSVGRLHGVTWEIEATGSGGGEAPPSVDPSSSAPSSTDLPSSTDPAEPSTTEAPSSTDSTVPSSTEVPSSTDPAEPSTTEVPSSTDSTMPSSTEVPSSTDSSEPSSTDLPTSTDEPIPTATPCPAKRQWKREDRL